MSRHPIMSVLLAALLTAATGCATAPDAPPLVRRFVLPGPAAAHGRARHADPDDATLVSTSPGGPFGAQMTLARITTDLLGRFESLEPIEGDGPIVLHAIADAGDVYRLLGRAEADGAVHRLSGTTLAADPGDPVAWDYTEQRGMIAGYSIVRGEREAADVVVADPVIDTAEAKVSFDLDPRFRPGGDGLPERWDLDLTMRVAGTPAGDLHHTVTRHDVEHRPFQLADPRSVTVRAFASIPAGATLVLAMAAPGNGPAAERPILLAVITPAAIHAAGPARDRIDRGRLLDPPPPETADR